MTITKSRNKYKLNLVPRYPQLNKLVSYNLSEIWEIMNSVSDIQGPFDDLIFDLDANCILKVDGNTVGPGEYFDCYYKEFEKYMKGIDKLL